MEPLTDDYFMRKVRDGDAGKLAVLFERHHRPLFRFFMHLTANRELSEDLVQDVFLRVLKYRQTYQAGTRFNAWLYQIARNAHLDHTRKGKLEIALPEEPMEFRSPDVMPEEKFGRKQETALLRKALLSLPVEKREVLVMSRFQNLKYDEIARILDCEIGAVKVRVYRAMKDLGDRYFALRGEKAS